MRRAVCAVALGVLFAGGGAAQAQVGLSLIRAGSGARAAGMGDAFIAVSDDGTAASWNPAGLAQLRQPEFSLVYVVSDHSLRLAGLRSPDGGVAYATPPYDFANGSIDFASAAVPFAVARKPVTLQVGWHRLYQLSSNLTGNIDRIPLQPPGPATVVSRDNRVIGDIDLFSAAGAVKLTSRLAVGASIDLWRGQWTERTTLLDDGAREGVPAFYAASTSVRLRGHNLSGGIFLTYPAWNVGLVYHAPFWSDFDVHAQGRVAGRPALSLSATESRFRLPRSVGAGLARRFGARWMVSAALTHDQWTDAVLDRFPNSPGPVSFFDNMPPSISSTRDTLSVNAGLEHLVLREGSVVPLRLGLGWEPQGGADVFTRDPMAYLLVSAGAGYNTNRFKLDAAVQYRRGSFRMSEAYLVETARDGGRDAVGLAAAREWRIKVSAIYRLADTDALRGAIRRILG